MNQRPLVRWLGLGLSIACIGYVGAALVEDFEALPSIDWLSPATVAALSAAVALYSLTLLLGGCAWSLLLCKRHNTDQLATILWISLTTQLAKYLPGNVGHIIGRFALAKMRGFDTIRLGISVTLETMLVIPAALFFAVIAFLSDERLTGLLRSTRDTLLEEGLISAALGAVAITAFAFYMAMRISRRFSGFIKDAIVQAPSPATLTLCLMVYGANYLLVGLSTLIVAQGVLGKDGGDLLILAGIFAIAWLPGFLTPGSPGGLGIREAVLLTGLTPLFGASTALVLALLLRLVTTLGDVVGFVMGHAIYWKTRHQRFSPDADVSP